MENCCTINTAEKLIDSVPRMVFPIVFWLHNVDDIYPDSLNKIDINNADESARKMVKVLTQMSHGRKIYR